MIFGEKKDYYIKIFFFTRIGDLGEKKVYNIEIFFSPRSTSRQT